MTWNHRLFRYIHKCGTEQFSVRETYYDENDEAFQFDKDPIVSAESIEDLKWKLSKMLECLENPIIDLGDERDPEVIVREIDEIRPHPNADNLELAIIEGWQIVVGKGTFKANDLVIHVPVDSMLTKETAEKLGVSKYLVWNKTNPRGRVKAARLRKEMSFGFIIPNSLNERLGKNLAKELNIIKYEEPETNQSAGQGQLARQNPLFFHYTNIENLRNHPDKLDYSIELAVTEKIHGRNQRTGLVKNPQTNEFELMVGSHRFARQIDDAGEYGLPLELYGNSIKSLLYHLADVHPLAKSIIIYGEIFGPGMQDLHYAGKKDYRVFDIAIDDVYTAFQTVVDLCLAFNILHVPILNVSDEFTFEQLIELAQGKSSFNPNQIREGIVVRPFIDELVWGKGEFDPNPKRMIFKLISDDYYTRKDGTEHH